VEAGRLVVGAVTTPLSTEVEVPTQAKVRASFKLSVSETERKARDATQLPYQTHLTEPEEEEEVEYIMDEDDEGEEIGLEEEEDPDADLDF